MHCSDPQLSSFAQTIITLKSLTQFLVHRLSTLEPHLRDPQMTLEGAGLTYQGLCMLSLRALRHKQLLRKFPVYLHCRCFGFRIIDKFITKKSKQPNFMSRISDDQYYYLSCLLRIEIVQMIIIATTIRGTEHYTGQLLSGKIKRSSPSSTLMACSETESTV